MKALALALTLALAGCGIDHHNPEGWTPEELQDITEAQADICEHFPEWCGAYGLEDLRRVEGPYVLQEKIYVWGFAFPDTMLALIWPDEIAARDRPALFRLVVTHELLHLSGCWEHHGKWGVMGRYSDDGITDADVEFCRSEVAHHEY